MLSRRDLHALITTDVEAENRKRRAFGMPELPIPSRRSIERWVKGMEGYSQVKRRDGAAEADRRFKAVELGAQHADRPGEIVQVDATRIDLALLDEDTGLTVQSPWLVVAMDVRTRVVLSAVLGHEPPSVEMLSALFRTMVQTQTPADLGDELPIEPFRPPGYPATLVLDNALENVGRSMQRMCEANGINQTFAAVKRPNQKGIVERFFGTLNQGLLHALPGGKPFTPERRQQLDIDPEREAVLTLGEAKALIGRFIFCEYHNAKHSTLGRTPRAQWEMDAAQHPLLRPASLLQFEYSLGFQEYRTLDRRGIQLHGLNYNGPQTSKLLEDLLPRAKGKSGQSSVRVAVRYLADDLSRVVIFNEVSKDFVPLPCVTPGFETPIGLFALKWLKARMREDGQDPDDALLLAQERADRVREIEALKRDRKLKNRSLGQRLQHKPVRADDEHQAHSEQAGLSLPAESASALSGVHERRPSKRAHKPRQRTAKKSGRARADGPVPPPQTPLAAPSIDGAGQDEDPVRQRFLQRRAARGAQSDG